MYIKKYSFSLVLIAQVRNEPNSSIFVIYNYLNYDLFELRCFEFDLPFMDAAFTFKCEMAAQLGCTMKFFQTAM